MVMMTVIMMAIIVMMTRMMIVVLTVSSIRLGSFEHAMDRIRTHSML